MPTTLVLFLLLGCILGAPPPLALSLQPNCTIQTHGSSNDSDTANVRTTQGIVWSCIATMFACTWIAIHPNLPDPCTSKWIQFKQHVATMILAILAPEFILIWALRQRIGAESTMREYNEVVLNANVNKKTYFQSIQEWFRNPPPPCKRRAWTITHGFCVQMGGFSFYDRETDWPVRVLHFHELLDLVQLNAVDPPDVTEEEISDKSKGDFLTKLLVVFQTTWFIVQCVARWMVHLPVTELEIMTFSFAVLNFITYVLWWQKPLNVGVGMRVQMKEGVYRRVAKAIQHDTIEDVDITDYHRAVHNDGPPSEPCSQEMQMADGTPTLHHPLLVDTRLESVPVGFEAGLHPRRLSWRRIVVMFRIIPQTLYLIGRGIQRAKLFTQVRRVVLGPMPTVGTATAIFTQAVRVDNSDSAMSTLISVAPGALSVGTFYAYDALQSGRKSKLVTFAVASGVLFGGLHLIPWRFAFPTDGESLLWRISALYIVLNPVLLYFPLVFFAVLSYRPCDHSKIRSVVMQCLPWVTPPIRAITIAIPLYIFARLSIIVLAFVTLRKLPPDAYKDISWGSFVPHM